jgi:hypothetical protein
MCRVSLDEALYRLIYEAIRADREITILVGITRHLGSS